MKTGSRIKKYSIPVAGILTALFLIRDPLIASTQETDNRLAAVRQLIDEYQYHQAELRLEEYVGLNPTDAEAWELLGASRQGRWDFTGAADAYRQALDLGRENAPLLRGLVETEGRSLSNVSLLFRARHLKDLVIRALEIDPYHVETRGMLAAFYFKVPGFLGGDRQKAVSLVEELVELSPADGYYLMGIRAQEEVKSDSTIIEYWSFALQHDPNHTTTLRSLGLFWIEHDSTDLALDYYRQAVSSDSGDPSILLSFGRAYRRAGMDDNSAVQFKNALGINPYFAPARLNLAEYYEKMGDRDAAVREYQVLALNNPTYQSKLVRKRLTKLIR